jgi:hypothetical protein
LLKLVPLSRRERKFGIANWSAYCGTIWSNSTITTRLAGVGADGPAAWLLFAPVTRTVPAAAAAARVAA